MRHLHRIVAVPFGTSILGLLNIFASIGFIWLLFPLFALGTGVAIILSR